jgi:phospholipid transport system substrate-binding protein
MWATPAGEALFPTWPPKDAGNHRGEEGERIMRKRPDGRVKADRPRLAGYLSGLFSLSLVFLPWSPASAGVPTDQLRASVDEVIRILEDPALKSESKTAERRAAIRKEADKIFDFEETAKRALGAHWQRLDEKKRLEFVSLFAGLLQRAYITKIEQYSGEKITYAGDAIDGDLAVVKTRFATKKGTEIPVDYRMLKRGDRWRVYDINIEGVGLVANYRTQFNKIIQTASYEELVAKLKNSQSELNANGGARVEKAPRS